MLGGDTYNWPSSDDIHETPPASDNPSPSKGLKKATHSNTDIKDFVAIYGRASKLAAEYFLKNEIEKPLDLWHPRMFEKALTDLISSKIVAELEHLFDRADGDRSARNYTSIVEQRLKVLKGRLRGGEK